MISNSFNNALTFLMSQGGLVSNINIIEYSFDPDDYDDVPLYESVTGSRVISGLLFPVKSTQGSHEELLMEQGKLLTQDKILYTGSFALGSNLLFNINSNYYTLIPDGMIPYEVNGSQIYQKIYLRYTSTGSIYSTPGSEF